MSNWKKLEVAAKVLEIVAENTTGSGGTNLDDIKTNTGVVADCVTSGNKLKVNLCELKDASLASGSDIIDSGTQRITIATDDPNLSTLNSTANDISTNSTTIATNTGNVATSIAANSSGYFPAYNIVIDGVRYGAGDVVIHTAGGVKTNGTLCVTLADDDTPVGLINSHLSTIEAKLTDIDNILNDVYVFTSHSLKTST